MKWIVSGTWDHTNEPGSMTLTAGSKSEACAVAKARGLTALEAMGVGAPPTAAPPAAASAKSKAAAPPHAGRPQAVPPPPPPRSPLREKAARLAVPTGSSMFGVGLVIAGLAAVVVGTYLAYRLGPEWWAGEIVQVAGVIGVVIGLRMLDT